MRSDCWITFKRSEQTARKREIIEFFIISAAVFIPRAWGITDPFIHLYDTAFQESLALSHLKYGLSVTKGIAGFGLYNGQFLFHAAHPPLLQLIYAGLYSIFGIHEWTSRAFCVFAAYGTALALWSAIRKSGADRAAFFAAMLFALITISVEIGRTTNYEPGALFFISMFLLGFSRREKGIGVALMIVSILIGGLFEWTFYLILPAAAAAILVEEKNIRSIKHVILPGLIAAVVLAAVFAWQNSASGSIPMFGHAATRSDPSALFHAEALIKYLSTLYRGIGIGWFLAIGGAFFYRQVYRSNPRLIGILLAYTSIPVLFFITAPQLALSHPLAGLYIVPAVAISSAIALERIDKKISYPIAAAIFLFYGIGDAMLVQKRAPFLFDFADLAAQRIGAARNCKAFDSGAVGFLRYYHDIETFHAVGANEPPIINFINDPEVCAVIVDSAHSEVKYVKDEIDRGASDGIFFLAAKLYDTELWIRGDSGNIVRLANIIESAELPSSSGNLWEKPTVEIIRSEGKCRYGILQHSRRDGPSTIRFRGVKVFRGSIFAATARMDDAVCSPPRSDGVKYSVTISSTKWSSEVAGLIDPRDAGCESTPISIRIDDAVNEVDIEFTVMGGNNADYDRFFWDNPRIGPPEAK